MDSENGHCNVVVGTNVSPNNEICDYTLKQCFQDIIEGKTLELDISSLDLFLKKGLKVNFYYLKPRLKNILPYLLLICIKNWAGWQRLSCYTNKEITFETWYEKFVRYLSYKINYIINNEYSRAVMLLKNTPIDESILFKIDNSVQTEKEKEKECSPISIVVQGSAKMLNTIIFCENRDSIVLREYRGNVPWPEKLSPRQIMNWPHVGIELRSKELHFKRNNMHLFQRFLTFSTDKSNVKKTMGIIEEADIVDPNLGREVYKLETINDYRKSYIDTLKKHQSTVQRQESYWNELDQLLEDLALDISRIGVNDTIATNTSILFKICNSGYARNRSIRGSENPPCFTEWFTPRVHLTFYRFSAIRRRGDHITFHHQELEELRSADGIEQYLPRLEYSCLFCIVRFDSIEGIISHLKSVHINEQPFLCLKCKKQYMVPHLTECRWAHLCLSN